MTGLEQWLAIFVVCETAGLILLAVYNDRLRMQVALLEFNRKVAMTEERYMATRPVGPRVPVSSLVVLVPPSDPPGRSDPTFNPKEPPSCC